MFLAIIKGIRSYKRALCYGAFGALLKYFFGGLTCLAFVLWGQYAAIGFMIAAKSILRFRDYKHSKTEYVLAGSMLGLDIAL